MIPEKKNQAAHGALALLVLLAVLALTLRVWIMLIPLMLGLFVYGMWALVHTPEQAADAQQETTDGQTAQRPEQVSEQELTTLAFGLLQRRITEQVSAIHPQARWTWAAPGARERFASGGPLLILLNGAGGYQRATVQVSDLKFYSLFYLPQSGVPVSALEQAKQPEQPAQPEGVDYGLLAFEWTEANLQRLCTQKSEAISNGWTEFHVSAEELPHGDSWPSICAELIRNGFADAQPVADGIQISIKAQGEEQEQK